MNTYNIYLMYYRSWSFLQQMPNVPISLTVTVRVRISTTH